MIFQLGTDVRLIGKALSNELGIEIIFINGSELASSSREEATVRLNFAFKRTADSPPAVILIDEVNQIGNSDDDLKFRLCRAWEEMESNNVFVLAVTSIPSVDLDLHFRQVFIGSREETIGIPNREGRLDILQAITERQKLNCDVDLDRLAKDTAGFTRVDLIALCDAATRTDIDKDDTSMESFTNARSLCRPSALGYLAPEIPDVTWEDIGGQEKLIKQMIDQIQLPMTHPEKYAAMGCLPYQTVLLHGPPGGGKTFLVKAVANMCSASLISINGPELADMYIGNTEKKIREVFDCARNSAPAIIYFDEFDSLGNGRTKEQKDSDAGVMTLLTEIGGMKPLKNVSVIASTNRLEALDGALIRPGRFERPIFIGLPDEDARKAILIAALRKTPKRGDFSKVLNDIARETKGSLSARCNFRKNPKLINF